MKFQIILTALALCQASKQVKMDYRDIDFKNPHPDQDLIDLFEGYDDEDLEEAIGKYESNVEITEGRMLRYMCTEDFYTTQWCEDYINGNK